MNPAAPAAPASSDARGVPARPQTSLDGRGAVSGYDFRRPIQLSREHARILQLGLEGFARQATTVFTSSLRTVCTVTLASIEQRAYSEYVDSLDATTYLTLFSAEPMAGLGTLEIPLGATMACIDHMLGGHGTGSQPERPLTEIESGVMGRFIERLMHELRYSLDDTLGLDPVVTGVEYSPQFAQVAGAADVMVVATFDLRVDELVHRMTTCLPFNGLLPQLVVAAAPAPVSERERTQRERSRELLQRQFEEVPIDVAIRFRPTTVSPGTFTDLQVGDVIRLTHPAAAPLDVSADSTTFAHATPGAKGTRLAALIVGAPKETR